MPFQTLTTADIRTALNANEIHRMDHTRYDGRCSLCGEAISQGEVAYYLTVRKQIVHPACFRAAKDEAPDQDEETPERVRKNPFRANTKRGILVDLVNEGKTRSAIYSEIRPLIVGQVEPFVYKENVDGKREPLPINVQLKRAWTDIARKITDANRPDLLDDFIPEDIGDEIPEEKPVKKLSKAERIAAEKKYFLSEVQRLRRFFADRAQYGGQETESISMRPVVYGRRMIDAGIPATACLYALCMHLSPETRQAAGIADYDQSEISEDLGEDTHRMLGYALKLARAGVPILLIGPKGSGKSEIAKQIAVALGVEYGECPLTAGATPTWLLGRYVDKYVPSDMVDRYANGGVFCFEEMDSGDPNMLLVVNNALASDEFHNPISGETLEKDPKFVPVATANTFGLGATKDYSGREKLDAATLDRWSMGRIYIDIDENLENHLMFADYESVDWDN